MTTNSRRLLMSTQASTVIALDPKYTSTGSDIHIGTVYPSTGKIELSTYFIGQTTSQPVSGFSLQDNSFGGLGTGWTTSQFTNCALYIIGGTGVGNTVTISTNSSNTLYWTSPSLLLDSTSQYMVIRSAINITTSSTIQIYSRPASNDIFPSRHQLLNIDLTKTAVSVIPDTFATSGVLGAPSYTTFSRDP